MAFQIAFAESEDLDSWMSFVEIVKHQFPGLDTAELLEGYRQTVIKNINRKTAICTKMNQMIVGILLFSKNQNMLSCMAVHPEYRKMGIATSMVSLMLEHIDRSRDISVITFREDDEKGTAARALYKKIGFEEAELCVHFDYPEQRFVLYAKK